jgi:hypothetical protein
LKIRNLILALAAVVALAVPSFSSAQSTLTLTTSDNYTCGRATSPLYCYGVPVFDNGVSDGTLWLDVYTSGYSFGHGFIYWFNNDNDLQEAAINGATILSVNSLKQVTGLQVTFSGETTNGGTYTGTAVFTFSYYYSSGGGGRGGAGAGWRQTVTGGTINISIQ